MKFRWIRFALAPAAFAQLEQAVAEVTHLLKELPDSSWGRPGQHPSAGRRSIKQQVRGMANHFNEHVTQLEGMRI